MTRSSRTPTAIILAAALSASACSVPGGSPDDATQPNGSEVTLASDDTTTDDTLSDDADTSTSVSTEPRTVLGFQALGEPGVGGRTTSLIFDPASPAGMLVGGDMLGVAWTDDPTDSWKPGVGLASWEISEFSYHPDNADEVWVGTMGGPYRSTDGGHSWTSARDGMPPVDPDGYASPVEVVRFDPNNSSRLIGFGGSQRQWNGFRTDAFAYGDVWESIDGGESWIQLANVGNGANIQDGLFSADGSTLLLATRTQGIHLSSDGGRTWNRTGEGLPHGMVGDLAVHPSDPDIFWAALKSNDEEGSVLQGGIYRSLDGGQSWSQTTNGMQAETGDTAAATASFERIVVSPTNPNRLYTSNVGRGQNAIYRSDDGGENWISIADGNIDRPRVYQSSVRAYELAVHPSNPDVVAFSQDDYILMSTDAGENWIDATTDAVGDDHFRGRGYSGLVSSDVAFDPLTPGAMAIAAFDGGNFIGSTDGGVSWRRPITEADVNWGGAEEIRYASDGTIYVLLGQSTANFRGVGVSTDGGQNFDIRAGEGVGLPAARSDLNPTGLAVNPSDPANVLVVLEGTVYQSVDNGLSFTTVLGGIQNAYDVEFAADGATVYVSSQIGVFASTDGASSAEPIPGSPSDATRITVDPLSGALYVTQYDSEFGGLNRFNGSSWERLIEDPQVHEVAVSPEDPNLLVVVTSDRPRRDVSRAVGVLISTDNGASWMVENTGLPMTRLTTAEFDPFDADRLVVGTTGRGFFEASIADLAGF